MAPTNPRRTRAAGPLAALGLVAAALAVVLGLLAVGTERGQRWDDAARGGVTAERQPQVFEGASALLDSISIASLALIGGGLVALALFRGRVRRAVGAGAVILGANVTTQIVKATVDRPDLAGGGPAGPGAYPSGHTTVAMSLAMALVLVVPAALRPAAAVAGCAYAAAVGVATIALDWHRPSEVVGAYLVAVAWTGLVAALLTLSGGDREPAPGRPVRVAGLVAGGVAAVAVALMLAAVARRLDLERVVFDRTAFVAGAAACAVACAVLCAAATALVGRAGSSGGPGWGIVPRHARRHPHRRR